MTEANPDAVPSDPWSVSTPGPSPGHYLTLSLKTSDFPGASPRFGMSIAAIGRRRHKLAIYWWGHVLEPPKKKRDGSLGEPRTRFVHKQAQTLDEAFTRLEAVVGGAIPPAHREKVTAHAEQLTQAGKVAAKPAASQVAGV